MSAITAPRASPIMERGPAQSPLALDGLHARTHQASESRKAAHPLVGLGFDFLQSMEMPCIHHVLEEQHFDSEEEYTGTQPEILPLRTSARRNMFDNGSPYDFDFLDVMTPLGPSYAEQRLTQAYSAMLVAVRCYCQPAVAAVVPAYNRALALVQNLKPCATIRGGMQTSACAALVALFFFAAVYRVGVSCSASSQ